jgi:hypothetical protein
MVLLLPGELALAFPYPPNLTDSTVFSYSSYLSLRRFAIAVRISYIFALVALRSSSFATRKPCPFIRSKTPSNVVWYLYHWK